MSRPIDYHDPSQRDIDSINQPPIGDGPDLTVEDVLRMIEDAT